MVNELIREHTHASCSSHRIKTYFYDKPFFVAKDMLKFLWVPFLMLLTIVSTAIAVVLINASVENREMRLSYHQDPKFNDLNKTIQEKLNYLLEQNPAN